MKEAFHLARVESGKLHLSRARQSVPELVSQAVAKHPSPAGKPVETCYPAELPAVDVDSELFVVALKQLVDNAAKYSPQGTPVRIRTAEASRDSVWIRVHNQGRGLSEEGAIGRWSLNASTARRQPARKWRGMESAWRLRGIL